MPLPVIGFFAGLGAMLTAYLGVALTNFLVSLGVAVAIFTGAQLLVDGVLLLAQGYVNQLPLFVRQSFYYLHLDVFMNIVFAAYVLAFSFKRVRVVPAAA